MPIFGDSWEIIFRKQAPPEVIQKMYNYNKDSRYVGVYQFTIPSLIIRDPELIKQVAVKDFDHFVDHRGFISAEADPLFGNNLLSLRGHKWREMRSTLSPSFTSSKMKYMFSLMSKSGEQFVQHFLKQNENVISVEMKDVLSRFANDIIGNTVFGFECDSLKEPNNEFFVMGKEASDFTSLRKIFVFIGYVVIPKLITFFKISLFSDKMIKYFTRIIKENIESREKYAVVRPDMISLLLEARKNSSKDEEAVIPDAGFATVEESEVDKNQKFRKTQITDEVIASQAFIFFFAGFDSVSSLMCFMAHELAVNLDVQEKLKEEIDNIREKCNGIITYEFIVSMKYMDMVVSETLRKWPNAIATDRICTKPYTIEPKTPYEKPVHLKPNDVIYIPMYAIQRDPKNYPDPDRFDPERFSEENKSKIKPYTFIPFGVGPRSCIGSRFALLETKILFYHLLSHFNIIPIEKTQIPIRFNRKAINMAAEKGFWLGLQRRFQ
ncbi:cytochrome P450 9e2-like isoform X2 [Zophobas morio]